MNKFEKNKNKLFRYLKSFDDILGVYLFGSYNDGSYNENSDIDIAVVYNKKKDVLEHDSMSVDIEKIFDNTKVDYINLEDVNIFFKFKIIKNGKLIYVTNEDKLYEYIHKVQNQYIEMSYSKKKYKEYVLNHDSLKGDDN